MHVVPAWSEEERITQRCTFTKSLILETSDAVKGLSLSCIIAGHAASWLRPSFGLHFRSERVVLNYIVVH